MSSISYAVFVPDDMTSLFGFGTQTMKGLLSIIAKLEHFQQKDKELKNSLFYRMMMMMVVVAMMNIPKK